MKIMREPTTTVKAADNSTKSNTAVAAKKKKEASGPDIYGQIHPEEYPELLEDKLDEFDVLLATIPEADKPCLCDAELKCPDLLTEDFKLMFLRCEVFDVNLAVKRYIKYWEKRVDIFGPVKAFQPLTIDGALCDDHVALHNGFIRLLRHKAVGGRSILFLDPSVQTFQGYTSESMARVAWYMFHAALEDTATQQKGLVFIVYPFKSTFAQFDKELSHAICSSAKGCLPLRLSGLHFCRPNTVLSTVFPFVKVLLGSRLRKRIKIHSCSDSLKAQAELDPYGLYSNVIPVEIGGTVVLDHDGWLEERRRLGK